MTTGTTIAAGTDLNDLTNPGNYVCASPTNIPTLKHCPTTFMFTLQVGHLPGSETYIWQKLIIWATGMEYYRSFHPTKGKWYDWFSDNLLYSYNSSESGLPDNTINVPKNAIIRMSARPWGDFNEEVYPDGEKPAPYLYYTRTNNGAFYATELDGSPKFGILPIAQGGTGADTAEGVREKLGIKDHATKNIIPLESGGAGQTFANTHNNAIIKMSSDKAKDPNLTSIPTKSGAFYATAEDGYPDFGVLPIAQGGTNNSELASAPDGVIIVKRTSNGKPFLGYISVPLSISLGGTGGTTALEAADKLKVYSLSEGTPITEGTDADTITTIGNYRCASGDIVKKLVNFPSAIINSGYAFLLKVGHLPGNSTYLYQELTTFYHGRRYYRKKSGSTASWDEWYLTYDSSAVIPITGGGHGATTAADACINLGALDIASRGTQIATNTNLNNIDVPGSYFCPNAETTETLKNHPFTGTLSGFKLLVIRGYTDDRLIQIAINSTGLTYLRTINNAGWQDWRQIC